MQQVNIKQWILWSEANIAISGNQISEEKRPNSILILYFKKRKKNFSFFFNESQKTKGFDSKLSKSCHSSFHEIFDFRYFSWISFSQAPEYPIRGVSNFSKICGDICKCKKFSIRKVLNILCGHLWVVELTYW